MIDLKNQVNNKNAEIKAKDRQLSEKETTNNRLQEEVHSLKTDLKNSTKETKR